MINPDAVQNQPEGGMSANWVLKEQVRFDNETASPIAGPVLRFSEVPEIDIEPVDAGTDMPPGRSAMRRPARSACLIRNLPLTRERIMAKLGVDELQAVADRGYYSGAEILACHEAAIAVTLPKPVTSGSVRQKDFRYVAEEDVYVCPAGVCAPGDRDRPFRLIATRRSD